MTTLWGRRDSLSLALCGIRLWTAPHVPDVLKKTEDMRGLTNGSGEVFKNQKYIYIYRPILVDRETG